MNAIALACAYALDLAAGDPEWLPHPVRLIGLLTSSGGSALGPGCGSARRDFVSGAALCASLVVLTAAAAAAVVVGARRIHPSVGFTVEVLLAWTALATGSLLAEARQVLKAVDRHDLARARRQLARIVGRDTADLSEDEIMRAMIETLAESTCDGIVAPLCYLVVGGVPGALVYKAVNTLDSMIGHREFPYTYFGRCAARLDDVLNFVPARATALAIAAAAAITGDSPKGALDVWRQDRAHHDSPNAGHPEAAMAGALGVRLGGVNVYDGVPRSTPPIGAAGRSPTPAAARRACRLVLAASILSGAIAVAACALIRLALR